MRYRQENFVLSERIRVPGGITDIPFDTRTRISILDQTE